MSIIVTMESSLLIDTLTFTDKLFTHPCLFQSIEEFFKVFDLQLYLRGHMTRNSLKLKLCTLSDIENSAES